MYNFRVKRWCARKNKFAKTKILRARYTRGRRVTRNEGLFIIGNFHQNENVFSVRDGIFTAKNSKRIFSHKIIG